MTSLPKTRRARGRGFALVVTLSLMILLTIIAVGLLSLSAISLRGASQGSAQAEAEANARLALMLAIGELQKYAGPDRSVTATSGILSETPTKSHLTGVWESWDFDPTSTSLDYDSEKKSRFRSWLVSCPNRADAGNRDFATTAWNGDTIEMVGDASLGGTATDDAKVRAGRVPVSTGGSVRGAYAWHVSDEAVKARINLYRDPALNDTLARKCALLAGHRPDPSVMKDSGGVSLDFLPNDQSPASFLLSEETVSKVTDLEQVDLLPGGGNLPGRIKPFRHDVTPYSLGLLTDVRHGGLKQDLSSVFEMSTSSTDISLPAELENQRLYQSTTGITGVSDPYWSTLSSYYNSFRNIQNKEDSPSLVLQAPSESITTDSMQVPGRFFPGPVIQKVEMMFSLVVRYETDNAPRFKNMEQIDPGDKNDPSRIRYKVHLMFTPVVTLHNPYNVSISFERLSVAMVNIPVSFQFFLNGEEAMPELLEFSRLFFGNSKNVLPFTLHIANWRNTDNLFQNPDSPIEGPIEMKPGQSLACSPFLPSDASIGYYDPDAGRVGESQPGMFFLYFINSNYFTHLKSKPGFVGTDAGYETDTVRHKDFPTALPNQLTKGGRNNIVLSLKDKLSAKFAINQPTIGEKENFSVKAKLRVNGNEYDYGGLSFDYGGQATLDEVFGEGSGGSKVYTYPEFDAEDAYIPGDTKLKDQVGARTFAVFSAYARTTNGGVYENGRRTAANAFSTLRDGRIAGMPYLFSNPARTVARFDLASERTGAHSHEMNLQPFYSGHAEDYFEIDTLNRVPALTGNRTLSGIKSGSYLEIPIGPMQTIADFRRSNALTSSYLPNFAQPVANSRVSPLMSTDKVKMTDNNVAAYELLDHSVLANHALYDRFYFSTFATDGNLTPDRAFENFMNGDAPLRSQAFQPYLPMGETVSGTKSKLFSSGKPTDSAYLSAAGYQMVRGPFNVNSTSIQAWKAILASINKGNIVTLWAKSAGLEVIQATGTPILPMSLINGGAAGGAAGMDFKKIDNPKTNDWNGYRELTESELETLATKIVDEVRARGPFLSMSEFVNRRIGSNSELTRMGALEEAIADAAINKDDFLDQVEVELADISDADLYGFNSPESSVGNPATGAPGWVSQGDLMRLLEPAATVRSDTFVIRVCGEAQDAKGNVTARAYAEAVVQRLPEYVDPTNSPSVNVYTDSGATNANKQFGRRFSVVSFRWLAGTEI